jgi:hypothetical protein
MKQKNKITKSISLLEISIMIIATFAFAYLVAIPELSLVNAEATTNCCLQTKQGQICQDIPYQTCSEECSSICQYSSCKQVAECSLGCCIDASQGNCVPNTPQTLCQYPNEWKNDASCNYQECSSGCCILGDKTAFVNSKKCEALTILNGLSTTLNYDFRQGVTEAECIALERSVTKGACLFISDEVNCKILTKEQCVRQTGSYSNFYENYLCTAPDLNTICNPTTETTCVDEKDEVYFLDSCDNIANIYDSSKIYDISNNNSVEYWTRILSKQESCNTNIGNINSASCGNCEYLLGSRCGSSSGSETNPDYGNLYCRDLNCYDVPTAVSSQGEVLFKENKKHGETWCLYESTIGNLTQDLVVGEKKLTGAAAVIALMTGKPTTVPVIKNTISGTDPVGSRHYLAQCLNGEISINPCDEYRNRICVQENSVINNETNEIFSSAACRINSWQECLNYNFEIDDDVEGQTTNDKMNECLENPDCYVKQINIASHFNFPQCLPKYKPAFDLTRIEGDANQICSVASQTCEVIYVKHWDGWDCEANCNCLSREFTLKMNEWCRSLGDCGAQTNIAGEVTTGGFKVSGAPALTAKDIINLDYKKLTDVEIGKFASPGNLTYFFKKIGIPPEMAQPQNLLGSSFMGGVMAGAGVAYSAIGWALGSKASVGGKAISTMGYLSSGADASSVVGAAHTNSLLFWTKAMGALAGASIGYMLAQGFGLSQGASIAVAVIGAAVALYGMANWGWTAPWIAVVAIAIAILGKIFGIGKTKSVYVKATCLPYEVPSGGNDCSLCNENELLSCNRYKCTSLGSACKYINEGTSNAKCIASVNDNSPPIISPLKFEDNYTYNILTNGYEIKDKSNNCFDAWQDVNIAITTEKFSQCKISTSPPTSFDNMLEYFPDTIYLQNHSSLFKLPSSDMLGAIGFDPSRTGIMNFYIRCRDDWGNKNPIDYVIKTCVNPESDTTPPIINRFSPTQENAFLGFEKTKFPLTIYINEPAECKYSFSNKDYEEMENNFACGGNYNILPTGTPLNLENVTESDVNISEIDMSSDSVLMSYLLKQTRFGFPCSADVNVASANSTIFIKCKDQPWYSITNESLRNSNTQYQPYPSGYKIKLSSSALSINSILPTGEIIGGASPFVVELTATTTGGADSTADCYFSFDNNIFSKFKNTGTSSHKTVFDSIVSGDYYLNLKCIDKAGNIALAENSFFLELDSLSPKVTRAYSSSGLLTITTNEDSECAYSTLSCNFLYNNGTRMDGYGLTHTTSIQAGKTYHIKCKDLYGNLPAGCSIKISKV